MKFLVTIKNGFIVGLRALPAICRSYILQEAPAREKGDAELKIGSL